MHRFLFPLLLAVSLLAPTVHAQEAPAADVEEQTSEDAAPAATDNAPAIDTLALQRLRQENQRLRLQLQEAQSQAPLPLLSEEQKWFAVGGSVGVASFLLGLLVTRGRRRRQWLN